MKRVSKIVLVILILCAAVGLVAGFVYYKAFNQNNVINGGGVVKVYPTTTYEELVKSVFDSEAIEDIKSFKLAAKVMKLDEEYKEGYYLITPGMNNKAIIRMLHFGWQSPVNITLSGYIRSYESLAAKFGSQLMSDSTAFDAAIKDMDKISAYGFTKETYLGMFIPNTYEVYWTASPEEILDRMKREYDAFWNEDRIAKAKKIGLSRAEVSTLASIVIEETKYEPEMPTVAGVYINRLKKGMLLQADPTVKFALNDPSVKRILNKHLKIDSPYNTYKYKGLPPGPITVPPISALDAVLNYQHHTYIYFCARDTFDGQHFFATTYSEHLKNARKYQKALTQRQKDQAK